MFGKDKVICRDPYLFFSADDTPWLEVLQLSDRKIVAITGGGGKTSLLYRLADDLASKQKKVLIATTTKICLPDKTQVDALVLGDSRENLAKIREALQPGKIVAVGPKVQQGKLQAITEADLARLAPLSDIVLLEADGAAGLPLKAPRFFEPVIPSATDLVLHVTGLSAIGQPWQTVCHKYEEAARLLSVAPEEPVTEEKLAALLSAPQGGRKGVPARAALYYVLNQADDGRWIAAGRAIAERLLQMGAPKVLLTRLQQNKPLVCVVEPQPKIAAVVLAAGEAKRMGGQKLLLPWGEKTVLDTVLEKIRASSVPKIYLVLGHEQEKIEAKVDLRGVEVIKNPDYRQGQSTSLKAAVKALPQSVEAVLFFLADQPLLSTELIERLLTAYQSSKAPLLVLGKDGRRGHPVLLTRPFFAEISELTGDVGARGLLRRYADRTEWIETEEEAIFLDLDTQEEYEKYFALYGKRGGQK